jgi:hypothetical protein
MTYFIIGLMVGAAFEFEFDKFKEHLSFSDWIFLIFLWPYVLTALFLNFLVQEGKG